jgi:Ser/Thr protein kinase RdoA (MazF antagonist)
MVPVPPRAARLVLVDPDGTPLGALPPVAVRTPWWPDVAEVVDAVRAARDLDVVVLRLLATARSEPHGGLVSYAAETRPPLSGRGAAALEPITATDLDALADHPLRMPWARPGGPAADLAWAAHIARIVDLPRVGPPVQVRTWNLSSLWRLPLDDGTSAWLKVVPPFFAHEGALLRALQGERVPRLIGHGGHRVLLEEIPGTDRHDAGPGEKARMLDVLVSIQAAWIGRTDDLLAIGLPDWRSPALARALREVIARRAPDLGPVAADQLGAFADGLPARLAAIDACGVPDTLVHGDFHGGNLRGGPDGHVLLDWGDAGVGNPLLDLPAMIPGGGEAAVVRAMRHWERAWSAVVPGADVARAVRLMLPVAAARQVLVFDRFLAGIEPTERVYHAADPGRWLRRVAELVARDG